MYLVFNVTRRVFDIDQFYISLECFRFDGENCDDLRKNYPPFIRYSSRDNGLDSGSLFANEAIPSKTWGVLSPQCFFPEVVVSSSSLSSSCPAFSRSPFEIICNFLKADNEREGKKKGKARPMAKGASDTANRVFVSRIQSWRIVTRNINRAGSITEGEGNAVRAAYSRAVCIM